MDETTEGVARRCLLSAVGGHRPFRSSATISAGGSLGLSICRTPQHPYPWISAVSSGGAAEEAGLTPGDYLLRINNTPLLGLSVHSVASLVREADDHVELFYWRPEGADASFTSMLSIQRLVPKMDEVLAAISCPICFEVPDIAIQCTNGHLLCLACRRRSFKCPICRTPLRTSSGVPLGGRNLLAEQLRSVFFGSGTIQRTETVSKTPLPSKETPMQKRAQSAIRQFTSNLFHNSIDLKGLQNHLMAMKNNKRMNAP